MQIERTYNAPGSGNCDPMHCKECAIGVLIRDWRTMKARIAELENQPPRTTHPGRRRRSKP